MAVRPGSKTHAALLRTRRQGLVRCLEAASPRARPILEALAAHMQREAFAPGTVLGYSVAARHLLVCAESGALALPGLTAEGLRSFAAGHTQGRCRCPGFRHRRDTSNLVAVPRLLHPLLHAAGLPVAPPAAPPTPTPFDALLQRFGHYRVHAQGLTPRAVERMGREVRRALAPYVQDGVLVTARLTPEAMREAVRARAAASGLRTAKSTASALRVFLRYLQGAEGVQGLEGALAHVPAVRGRRFGSGPPRAFSAAEEAALFAGLAPRRAVHRRNHAIFLMGLRMALRASDIFRLQLEDVDWRRGEVRIVRQKGRRETVLPLPRDVGAALAAYLRCWRPKTPPEERHLFVRHRHPWGGPLPSGVLSSALARAARRGGLAKVEGGTGGHRLRHTAAVRMAARGVGLTAIAATLRHQDVTTSAIYTRVGPDVLRPLALPWPSGTAPSGRARAARTPPAAAPPARHLLRPRQGPWAARALDARAAAAAAAPARARGPRP